MKLTTKEENQEVIRKVIEENQEIIDLINNDLILIGDDYYRTKGIAEDIFIKAIQIKNWFPIQSFVGMLYKKYADDTLTNRANVFDEIMQLIIDCSLIETSVLDIKYSKNNHLMVKGKYYDDEISKSINLPYDEPQKGHIRFGSIKERAKGKWEDVIEILNNQKFTIDKSIVKYFKFDKDWSNERVADEKRKQIILREIPSKKPFYFKWGTDYRGRIYCSGDTLNPQGDDYRKSMLKYEPIELNSVGEVWLKIKIASAFGLDKEPKWKQLTWFNKNEKNLEKLRDNADDRYEYITLVNDYRKYQNGKSIGTIVGVDAPQSQLQILALILKSKAIAKASNLIGDEKQDNYKKLAEEMSKMLGVKLDRSEVKYMLMTFGYGAGDLRLSKIAKRDFKSENIHKLKMEDIIDAFHKAVNNILPGLEETMKEINSWWNPSGISFTMPDGFKVNVFESDDKYFEGVYDILDDSKEIKFKADGIISKKKKSLLPFVSIVHAIDGYIAREMVRRTNDRDIDIYTIHDDFRVHPNYAQWCIDEYRKIFQELLDKDIVYDIIKEAFGIKIRKNRGDLRAKDIDGSYILF